MMSHTMKRGETVSLNALASKAIHGASPRTILSNTELVRKCNDLTALHLIMKVRGV